MVKAKSPYPPTPALLIKQQFHLILDTSTFFFIAHSHTRVRITKCSKSKTQANGGKAGFELSKFSSAGNKTKLMNYSSLNLNAISFVLGCVQTDAATTPNIVGATILGVVASVLAVVCKRMQQLSALLGPTVHRGKDTTHKSL